MKVAFFKIRKQGEKINISSIMNLFILVWVLVKRRVPRSLIGVNIRIGMLLDYTMGKA
jgi:hypothetical protein